VRVREWMEDILLKAETTVTKGSIARGDGRAAASRTAALRRTARGRLTTARRLGTAQTRCHHHPKPLPLFAFFLLSGKARDRRRGGPSVPVGGRATAGLGLGGG